MYAYLCNMAFRIEKYHFITGSILEGLPSKEFKLLKEEMTRVEKSKGEIIYKEGSHPKGIYILRKGKVKIFQTNGEGREQIVYIYKKGEIMGYRPIISKGVHPVSAVALEDCVLSYIPKKYFLGVLENSLTLSTRFLVNLSHEFTVWTNKISLFTQQPVRERVAISLLILNEKYRTDGRGSRSSVITLSRQDLANYVGTAKETLVRVLQDFKKRRIVRTEGQKIIILNTEELEAIADLY
jgi:CRP-like cAMP-binding protein